jgi:uncharacterized protein (TIGR02145 family)
MKKAGLILITFIGFGCIADAQTISIGSQIWMTKNLDVSYFRNGDTIPHAKTSDEWNNAGEMGKPAWCYYNNDSSNGAIYGKLYNWYAVNDPRGLAPRGWHVPGDAEWSELTNYLGGDTIAGGKMKSTNGWRAPNEGATDSSGFSGLPGGDRLSYGPLYNISYLGFWWSSTESNTDSSAWVRILNYNDDWVYRDFCSKGRGLSVRCVKGDSVYSTFTDPRDNQTYKIVKIGNQWWFAQNLNYQTANSSCFDYDSANCATYGRLYAWETAKAACPSGWHLPSNADWSQLIDYLGGYSVAGGKLKSTSALWLSPNTGATNSSGFSALPGGTRTNYGPFYYIGYYGYWWSSTESSKSSACLRGLTYDYGSVVMTTKDKFYGFSCRCLRD